MTEITANKKTAVWKWIGAGCALFIGYGVLTHYYRVYLQRSQATAAIAQSAPETPAAATGASVQIKNIKVFWRAYTDGAHFFANVDLANQSREPLQFILTALVIDDTGKIRKELTEFSATIPPGLTQAVATSYPFGFGWLPDGWHYRLYLKSVDSTDAGNGVLIDSGVIPRNYGT